MKRTFILDENVFIQTFTCKDIKKSKKNNFCSLQLILWIHNKCHKIGLSKELSDRYLQKSQSFRNNTTIRIWKDILLRKDKQRWSDNHLKELPSNIEHDRHVIEPTLFLKATLVTMDEKLKDRLTKWGGEKHLKILIKSPTEILEDEN